MDLNEIVLSVIGSVGIPLAVYVIRYVRNLVASTTLAKKTQIDDFIFKTLEDQVVTHMEGIVKAKRNHKASENLKEKAKTRTLAYVKLAAKKKGINITKTYGNGVIEKMLHTTVKKMNKEVGIK